MNDNVKIIVEKLKAIVVDFKSLKESIDEVSEWNSVEEVLNNMNKMTDFISNVVVAVEFIVKDLKGTIDITSEDKRKAAAEFIDGLIDLPWYLEAFDGPAIEAMLSIAVGMFNKYFGDGWFAKIVGDRGLV